MKNDMLLSLVPTSRHYELALPRGYGGRNWRR